jgi:hypothetical protein
MLSASERRERATRTERAGALRLCSGCGERSRTAKRRARERVREFRLRQGYGGHRRRLSGGVPRREVPRGRLVVRCAARASAASEPRERREPAERRARERAGESEGQSPSHETSGLSSLIKNHVAGGASRLAALLLPRILPVLSVVAPGHPGAALRDLVLVQRRQTTSRFGARGESSRRRGPVRG